MQDQIDTNLYSRQIGTFGMETMGKLIKLDVLIVGMRGLGVETAKNLILAGPHRVDVWDNEPVHIRDLGANFYLTEADVGKKTRGQASYEKLRELNNYVKVDLAEGSLGMDLFSKYHAVVFTEIHTNINDIIAWNKQLRAKNIATILTQSMGLYGYTFCDFGDDFKIHDPDGERTHNFVINEIEKEIDEADPSKSHIVVILHDDKRHTYSDESYVSFREVQGMTQLNGIEPKRIRVIDGFSFKVFMDPSTLGDYTGGGIVEDVKVPIPHRFQSLEQAIINPLATARDNMFYVYDFAAFERPGHLHLAF